MERTTWFGSSALGTLGVALLVQGLSGVASADTLFIRDRNFSVLEQERPEFAAVGIRAGQFIVKPRVDASLGYTTNAFALSEAPAGRGIDAYEEESDTYVALRPSFRADSLWSRHSVSFGGYADVYANRRFNSEALANYGLFLTGKLDLTRQAALFGGISFDELIETRRANTSSILSVNPVSYDLMKAHVGGQHELGRVVYNGRIDLAKYDYDDVEIVPIAGIAGQNPDQDFRDRTSYSMLGKVGFAVTRDFSVFFSSEYNFQEYDAEIGEAEFDRDSEGWVVAIGADFDITKLIRGSVAVGQFEQQYDDIRFDDAEGMSLEGRIEWFPTERTTVSLRARQGADESAVAVVGGAVVTETVLRVDQEIRRNVTGYALAGLGELEFPDKILVSAEFDANNVQTRPARLEQQDIERFRVGAGATWFVNRNLQTSVGYLYETQDVGVNLFDGGFDSDYSVHQLLLTLTLKR